MDSIRYKFLGLSVPQTDDTIAIYLLNGSQDPALATTKQLLFDFRGVEFVNEDLFKIKTAIPLPTMNGLSHIALRYRNSNCSSNWLYVHFDNVAISGKTVSGTQNLPKTDEKYTVFPNPASGKVSISGNLNLKAVSVYNLLGTNVLSIRNELSSGEIDLSGLPRGPYFIEIFDGVNWHEQKIILH